MHQPFIIQHLFQVSSLEDVSRERLEAFVEAYPSYGIGHYLLSCKLQAEGSERFMPETQRTCLYFSNPLWLQWQLQNPDGMAAARPAETPAPWVAEPLAVESPAIGEPVDAIEEPGTPAIEEPNVEGTVENLVTMAEDAFVTPESLTTGEIGHITAGEGENLGAASPAAEEFSAAEQLLRSIEEARELRESLQRLDEEATAGTAVAGESLTAEPEPLEAAPEPVAHEAVALQEEPVVHHEEPIQDEETPFVLDEPEEQPVVVAETPAAPETQPAPEPQPEAVATEPQPETVATEPQPEAAVTEPQSAAGSQPVADPSTAAPAVTQDFLFEPYHTIDYFASQGIKLTLDENPQDKLGKQLKSFTEWLKTMRRLPQKDREVVPDRVMEEAIQTSAAHSIQGKDVLTETMAEVLAKQGMREKARAVYEKLSLLNPDKRAYFAAKIEQLNIP
ncbi:MAG TPA: hypothetical protein VGS79_18815 [Puia sp.]|nr:hypothetical protein [Puia sp.]